MSFNSLKRPPSPRINVASYTVASGGCHQAPQPRIKAEKAGNTADGGQYRRLVIGHSGNAIAAVPTAGMNNRRVSFFWAWVRKSRSACWWMSGPGDDDKPADLTD